MAERVLMKGNEAIAEAAIRAGCRHYFGYPITPQTDTGCSCAVNHVDGCDFTFCLQEDTADLGHLLCHIGSDLGLGVMG